ncbi:MAG: heavy metal-responsive transcriptional regulator [Desulfobulbaceae bacterium]|nr:heavy metal-responsive transcriptional regulator [Desulfobulbaceae bacterium]
MHGLTIGKLAKKAGLTIDTVRFYERRGLINEPARTQSNYRMYPEEDVARLIFIKKAKDLGFSLSEIKELLFIQHDPDASKSDVKERTEAKIRDVRCRIKDLTRILKALEQLSKGCDGHGPASACPILEALSGPEEEHHHHNGGGS